MSTLRLRTDALGYLVDEEPTDGFPDRPELPRRQRVTIAQWAARFAPAALSDEQRSLLVDVPPLRSSARQRGLAASREVLAELVGTGLWETLSEAERGWVLDPATHPRLAPDVRYPLSTGQLARLCGASEKQARGWIDSGLVSATREGGARRVYAGGVAQALLLAHQPQPEKTVLARVRNGEASSFVALVANAVKTWAQSTPGVALGDVERVCRGMSLISRAMAGELVEGSTTLIQPVGGVSWETTEWSIDEQRDIQRFSCVVREPRSAFPALTFGYTASTSSDVDAFALEGEVGEQMLALREEAHAPEDLRDRFWMAIQEADIALLSIELLDGEGIETVVKTIPHGEGWANKVIGNSRVSNVARTKAEAERVGREMAMKRRGIHLVYRKDGSLQWDRIYRPRDDAEAAPRRSRGGVLVGSQAALPAALPG